MASWWGLQSVCMVLVLLLASVPGAEGLDGGDAVALLLGLAISTVGLCACLGWYARRRNGQL
ncbi:small integral membrane protein 30-like [Pristis pectinata]|uniref:small integral membrane protein 30-like n=1 Tax=Pristis pectinata TaxID=685728 RepID=UPI00223DCEEE|nr:small integral membrane protein 30-like [Pristis pectinata]